MLRKTNTLPKSSYHTLNSANSNEFNALRQQWNIAQWCREQGIDPKVIERHPCVADIRTLLDFDRLDHLMTKKDREIWQHAWAWVYQKQLPISVYIDKRLLSIVENCQRTEFILRRKQRQAARLLAEMKEAAMGYNHDEIGDHNIEAKGSQSATDQFYGQLHMDDGSRKG
jgi:diketogulonate reductase-like aldo/keto reductase